MEFQNTTEARTAICNYHNAHPAIKAQCELGKLAIVHPEVAPDAFSFYILGFNGTAKRYPKNGEDELNRRYVKICKEAMDAVGVSYFIMAERCFWGSPTVGGLRDLVGSEMMIREVLKMNASANRALFREHPPLVVWALGLSQYPNEAIEDYRLTEVGAPRYVQKRNRRDRLWQQYDSSLGFPVLFTKHPAAWLSKEERSEIHDKLARLAGDRR